MRASLNFVDFNIADEQSTLTLDIVDWHLLEGNGRTATPQILVDRYDFPTQSYVRVDGLSHRTKSTFSVPLRAVGSFPLDSHRLELRIWAEVYSTEPNGQTEVERRSIVPKLYAETGRYTVDEASLDIGVQYWPRASGEVGLVQFEVKQSFKPKFLCLLLGVLFLVYSGLVVTVPDVSSLLESSIALALGIWGVRSLVVPSDIPPELTSGIDTALLFLYCLLASEVLIWLLIRVHPVLCYVVTGLPLPQSAPVGIRICTVFNSRRKEYVEIANFGGGTQGIGGWSVSGRRGVERYTFLSDFVLRDGEHVVLHSGEGGTAAPPHDIYWTHKNIWSNEGEVVYLWDDHEHLVDAYVCH